MKHLQRNWRLMLIVFVLTALGGAAWFFNGRADRVVAGGDPPAPHAQVAVVEREALLSVLGAIDLDPQAMAALNVTEAQALELVGEARAWYEANQSTLAAQQAAIAQRLQTVRTIQKRIRMGPLDAGNASALATARQELKAARASYDESLAGLKTSIGPLLSETQQATWTAIQNGWSQTLPLRMLALTRQQRSDYARAKRHYELQMANARTPESRQTAETAWQSALATILTDENRRMIVAYDGYASQALQNTRTALETVLPADAAG
ncbi:MAG: hypothetical protein JXB13_01565 [Phycisphaerae bacterium]|nr:hypothetical protein [Phycisphaerae bacterium]